MKNYPILLLLAMLGLASCAVKPVATFTLPIEKHVAPATVQFSNSSQNAETYLWDFGDGNSSTEANPTHKFEHSGNYIVQLKATKGNKTVTTRQMLQVTAPERCLVEIQTNYGNMIAELYATTPLHRDNFTKLAEEGYYDGLLFHRVISGFMIQGGDPNSRDAKPGQSLGFGGPTYQIPAEFVDALVHTKGALAAARTSNPQKASSGSQFYIVQGNPVDDASLDRIEAMKNFHYTPEQRETYKTLGGTPQARS
ncbi:MAG: peptidylprolyl isomerase [Lewinellaceae bacterium]|nr:peptidylprolyl isomerase [Lewinellaceae bacterium]